MTKFANQIGYSDVNPFEVIRVVSDKTIEIRAMNAERDNSVKMEFISGGFSAHCANQADQNGLLLLMKSIQYFGFVLAKIVDGRTNMVNAIN